TVEMPSGSLQITHHNPQPDHRARNIAIGFLGTVAAGVLVFAIAARLRRAR
ncbi:hypothetical protein, partial [Mycobacterium sp. 852002-40037_SCH5390672]|uniref:hypothetical protein n=1 Tax=Mycobacterium sp. 852002-40037_SCH5390672 TaxID=1834089 RepID=UPI000A58BDA5